MKYVVINMGTAEVEFFSDEEQANKFIEENGFTLYNEDEHSDLEELDKFCAIMPCVEVENTEEVELIIEPNIDKSSEFGSVAEYQEDIYNSDFIDAPNVPIKYMSSADYYKE